MQSVSQSCRKTFNSRDEYEGRGAAWVERCIEGGCLSRTHVISIESVEEALVWNSDGVWSLVARGYLLEMGWGTGIYGLEASSG